jgi:hypothetical protein
VTINLRGLFVLAIATLGVHGATPSFAQSDAVPQGKPAENVRQAPGTQGQTLDVSMSLSAAYDSDLSVSPSAATPYLFGPELITNSNNLLGSGRYQWQSRDVQFLANGTSQWVHDRRSGLVSDLSHAASANLTARLPRHMTLLLDQTTTHTPSPLYSVFPRVGATGRGEARSAAPDSGANDIDTYAYAARATLEQALTRRNTLSVTANGDYALTARRSTNADQSELASYGMSSQFARLMTRNTRGTVRYSYRAVRTGRGVRLSEHGLDLALTYDRPLSVTRRMVFDVVLGGVVVAPRDQLLAGPLRLAESYRLVGEAGAMLVFARTWQAGATYRRGVDYVPGLNEPVLTDGFSGRLEGSFSRRVQLQAAASYASGASALLRGGASFDTYTSDVKLSMALTRGLVPYLQYVYYLYDFRRFGPLMPGLPPALERNGLRVGFTLSVPTLDW